MSRVAQKNKSRKRGAGAGQIALDLFGEQVLAQALVLEEMFPSGEAVVAKPDSEVTAPVFDLDSIPIRWELKDGSFCGKCGHADVGRRRFRAAGLDVVLCPVCSNSGTTRCEFAFPVL